MPLHYALVVLRESFLKGAGIMDQWVPLLTTVAFSVVIFSVAVARFSRTLGE